MSNIGFLTVDGVRLEYRRVVGQSVGNCAPIAKP
jgi:hypothetical protein